MKYVTSGYYHDQQVTSGQTAGQFSIWARTLSAEMTA